MSSPIITNLTSEGPIDHHKMAEDLAKLYDRKADSIYVIMDAAHTTVVKDPGLNRPWCNSNPRIAERIAKQITKSSGRQTHVVTLSDAIRFLCGQSVDRNN